MSEKTVRRRDRQIVRVLWLLKALAEGSQVSVSELARRFGTRRETIYRDLRKVLRRNAIRIAELTGSAQGLTILKR